MDDRLLVGTRRTLLMSMSDDRRWEPARRSTPMFKIVNDESVEVPSALEGGVGSTSCVA